MKSAYFYVNRFFDGVNIVLAVTAGLSMGFLLVAICVSTLSRFIFNRPFSNLVEYSSYSLIYIAFLSGPWLLSHRRHISVDIITNVLKPGTQKIMDIFICVLGLVITLTIGWFSLTITLSNFQNDIRIMDSMRTPQWIVGADGMFLYGLSICPQFGQECSR